MAVKPIAGALIRVKDHIRVVGLDHYMNTPYTTNGDHNMTDFPIRKTQLFLETIFHEGGPIPETPRMRAAMVAVVSNPFAGGYHDDLQSAMDDLKPLWIDDDR